MWFAAPPVALEMDFFVMINSPLRSTWKKKQSTLFDIECVSPVAINTHRTYSPSRKWLNLVFHFFLTIFATRWFAAPSVVLQLKLLWDYQYKARFFSNKQSPLSEIECEYLSIDSCRNCCSIDWKDTVIDSIIIPGRTWTWAASPWVVLLLPARSPWAEEEDGRRTRRRASSAAMG